MSKSEAVVIESIEVRELLRFLFYLDILNKLSLLQRKHSKYMYAKCLNFPCFITYLAACMHAFCMFYLYVSLGLAHSVSIDWSKNIGDQFVTKQLDSIAIEPVLAPKKKDRNLGRRFFRCEWKMPQDDFSSNKVGFFNSLQLLILMRAA